MTRDMTAFFNYAVAETSDCSSRFKGLTIVSRRNLLNESDGYISKGINLIEVEVE